MTEQNEQDAATIDPGIRIDVETRYLADQSEPDRDRYVFAYTITISNQGHQSRKLLSRHWLITDAGGDVEEVRSDGVVGQQPYLPPGQVFEYTSGAILKTPVGAMQGSYEFCDEDDRRFTAPILPFSLAVPELVH